MSGVNARSVGRLRLHPGTPLLADPVVDSGDEFDIDPTALAGREAINWGALRAAAHAAMDAHSGVATFRRFCSICRSRGRATLSGCGRWRRGLVTWIPMRASWSWRTPRGPREISVPYLVFGEPIPDPSPHLSRRRLLSAQRALLEGIGDA